MTTAALVAATAVVVSGGAHQAGAAPGPTTQTIKRTFHYSGVGAAYTVPAGTVSLALSVTGAAGGYDGARFQDGKEGALGGLGMQVNATLSITAGSAVQPGDQLYVSVGSVGTASSYHLSKNCVGDGDCDFDYSCYQPGAGGSSPLGLMPNLSGGGGGKDGVALVGGNAGGCGAGGGAGSAIVLASGAPFVVAGGGGGGGGAGRVDADNDGAISADHLGGDGGNGDNGGDPGAEPDNPYSAGPAGVTNGAPGTAGSSGGSGSAVNGLSTGGGGGGGGGYTTGTGNGGGSGGGHGSGGGGGGAGGTFYLDPNLLRGPIEGEPGDEVGNGIVTITATIGGGAALLTLGVFNPGPNQTFTVPAGVDQIDVDAVGALGGGSGATAFASEGGNQSASASPGAPGAEVKATINVQPGHVLTINLGTVGSYDRNGGDPHAGRGGNFSAAQYAGGGGGGAAWIVDSTNNQNLIAAGGGGGSGGVTTAFKRFNGNGGAAGTQPAATPAAMPGANGTKGSGGSAGLGGGATGCTGKQSANGSSPDELDLSEGGGGGGGSGGFAHAGCGGGASAGGGGGESAVANGQLIATPSPAGYGDGLIVLSAHLPAGSTLIPVGSNLRSALTGTTFTPDLQVLLRDPDDVPLPGIPVTFTVASGAYFGTPTTTSDTELTGSDGIATAATLTAGLAAGQYTLTAAVPGGPSTGFTLTVVPMSITVMDPTQTTQTIPDFGSFAPLAARVTAGQGLSVARLSVTFAVAAGQSGITFPGGATSVVETTGVDGTVASPAPIATGPIGTVQVTATIAITGQSTTFTLTTTPLTIQVTGAPQSTLVDTDYPAPLVARVVDQDADPQPGVTVYFVDPSGNIHFDDTGTSVTDSNGLATSPALQPTTAGQITVLAGVTANPSALLQTPPAQFALSAAVPGHPLPVFTTSISQIFVTSGGQLSDQITVQGTQNLPGTATWTLVGPVVPNLGSCINTSFSGAPPAATGTVAVTADGTVSTAPTTVGAPGCYSYAVSIDGPDYAQTVAEPAGAPSETAEVGSSGSE